MISNPAKFFINGNNQEKFTYEPDATLLWHFSPNQSGLSNSMEMNIIFFANNATDAIDIVEQMLKFAIKCETKKYINIDNLILNKRKNRVENFRKLLNNKKKWIVTLAPMDQIYKVGWAGNDTI